MVTGAKTVPQPRIPILIYANKDGGGGGGGGDVAAVLATLQEQMGELNAKLDDFGGAGELTVQMRTARGPRTDDFDTLLSSHVSAKERAEQPKGERRPEQPPKGYVCNCCGIEGHWIFNCPTAGTGGPPGPGGGLNEL